MCETQKQSACFKSLPLDLSTSFCLHFLFCLSPSSPLWLTLLPLPSVLSSHTHHCPPGNVQVGIRNKGYLSSQSIHKQISAKSWAILNKYPQLYNNGEMQSTIFCNNRSIDFLFLTHRKSVSCLNELVLKYKNRNEI